MNTASSPAIRRGWRQQGFVRVLARLAGIQQQASAFICQARTHLTPEVP
jgi:hypothetical protein